MMLQNQRKIITIWLGLLCFSVFGLFFSVNSWISQGHHNEEARKTLERDIGKTDPSTQETSSSPWGLLTEATETFQMPSVEVHETTKSYEITIPIAHANTETEKEIKTQVRPNLIVVSGEIPIKGPSGQIMGSSSFMKSFVPSSTVKPESLTRKVTEQGLLITILKAKPGTQSPSSEAGHSGIPSLQDRLRTQPQKFI